MSRETANKILAARKKVNQIGAWSGIRMLRNKGYSFNEAHFIMFGALPRFM